MGKLGLYIEEVNEKTTQNNQYEVLTSSQGGIVSQEDYFNKQVASTDNTGYKVIRKGQFTYRSMSDTGRFYINRLTNREVGIVSPAYPVFKIASDKIMPEYLSLFFQSEYFQSQISNKASGSTRLALRYSKLENVEIDIPSFEEQDTIVGKIFDINELIRIEEKSLSLLDELTKSRFNELFMHRVLSIVRLVDISIANGEYGAGSASTEYDPNRPRYVRITDINDDGTLNDDFVSSKVLSDDNEYRLSYGDFLFARMGATVGKTYAFYSGNQIYAGYLIRYKLDLNKINPRYLYWYTKQNEYWDWVKLKQSGAAQPGINAKKYDSLEIPLAPIKEQDEFASFVEQIDKLKFNVQQRIEKYKELLNKKMSEYFN